MKRFVPALSALAVIGALVLASGAVSAAAGDWLDGTTTEKLLSADTEGFGSKGGVSAAPSFLFGEKVIRKSRRLANDYDYVQHLVKRASESLAEDVAGDALVLFEKEQRDREFCFSEACIADWLGRVTADWEEIIDAIDRDQGEATVARKLRETLIVSDLSEDRPYGSQSKFIQACNSTKESSGAGCFMASFEEARSSTGYLQASCQRAQGAPSGLACAMAGVIPALGIRGHGNQVTWKADAMYEKACYLKSGSSCVTLGDWYFLNGDDKKAREAYLRATTLGEEIGAEHLAAMKDNPVGLIAWIQSHPTPAQTDWFTRCNAPYGNNDQSALCLKALESSQNKRLINVLNEIGVEEAGVDLIERAVDKLATTVGNMAAKERAASGTPRYRGATTIFRVKSKIIERLSLLATGEAGTDILVEDFYNRCTDDHCKTLKELKAYLKEQYDDFRETVPRYYGEDSQQAAIVLDALTWIWNSNNELAARLTRELKFKYDTTVLEALVLSDMLDYQEATRRVF